jgi:hypothetical protein
MNVVFGSEPIGVKMEIKLQIPDDYCQGNSGSLDSVDIEETQFPFEDRAKPNSVKVRRAPRNTS